MVDLIQGKDEKWVNKHAHNLISRAASMASAIKIVKDNEKIDKTMSTTKHEYSVMRNPSATGYLIFMDIDKRSK